MEQGKEHPAVVDSDPNHVAANVVVAPPLPPTITNPVFNNAKRAAHEEPQQVMCTKKHKTDVQSNFMEYQHHCQHNKVEVPLCTKSSTTQSAKQENTSSNQFQQDDEDYNSKMKNSQHITLKRSVSVDMPPDKKSMATTQDSHKGSISNELLEDGDETFKEIYEHTPDNIALKLNNKLLDHSERLDLAIERTIHPATTSHATGSKTLYLGNLSFAVEEDDVRDFFKDVGEIAAIRFAIRDDRFLGYGHIEFTTSEAAQEALKLNKEVLYDRRVKLDLARERGTYPPGNSMVKYNSTGGQAQRKTVFVRGFRSSDGFDIVCLCDMKFGKYIHSNTCMLYQYQIEVAVWVGHTSWLIARVDHASINVRSPEFLSSKAFTVIDNQCVNFDLSGYITEIIALYFEYLN